MTQGIGRASILISILSAVNMALGLVNQIVVADYFGTSAQLDSFLIATTVPSIFSGIALSVFSSSLMPILTPIREDRNELSQAVSTVTFITLIFVLILTCAGVGLKERILKISTNLDGEDLVLAARLAGYIWIITGFVVLNALCASLFNLSKQFNVAAVAGLFPSMGMIIGTLSLGSSLGIEGLVMGWLAMTMLSSTALLPVLVRCGVSWRAIRVGSPYAREYLKALMPVSMGLLPFTVLPSSDAFWASRLAEGSMSSIGYCTKVVVALGSLVVSGVYVVIMPYLSECAGGNDLDGFSRNLRLAIKYVLMVTIPLVTFCAFFGKEIVSALFQRGHFGQESTEAVASLLPWYLVGLLAMAPATILSRGYFALKRYKHFVVLSLAAIAMYFVMSGLLSYRYSFYGIGVAYAIYWIAFVGVGILLLHHQVQVVGRKTLMSVIKCAGCSLASCMVTYLVFSGTVRIPGGVVLVLQGMLTACLFMALSYYANLTEVSKLRLGFTGLLRRQ